MLARRLAEQLRRSRITLFILLPIAAVQAAGFMDFVTGSLRLLYIVLGFSLIIFLHELGHFMVARWCSVKCLAFSIGIGPRMCGWRKHGGFSFGSDPYDTTENKGKKPISDPVEEAQKHRVSAVESDLQTTAREPHHPPAVGDCDYRLSWFPLGGYVRMLGQDDMDPTKVSTDPHAFNRRPIWQRMCIVSAGVIMNVIFAAVTFSVIFSPGIGVDFPPARVGFVAYGMPAWEQGLPMKEAKLHRGDQIISINGEKPRGFLEFTDVMMAAALSKRGESFRLEVIRYGTGAREFVDLVPVQSNLSAFQAFGIEAMPGLEIGGPGEDYTNAEAEKAFGHQVTFQVNKPELQKLKDEGWKIVGVDGIDLQDAAEPNATHDKFVMLANRVNEQNGRPVDLALQHTKTGAPMTIKLQPHIEWILGEKKFPTIFGLSPQVVVSDVIPKTPAAGAGIKGGDRIVHLGDKHLPEFSEVQEIIASSRGAALNIEVEHAPAAASSAPATAAAPASAPAMGQRETLRVAAKKNGESYFIGIHHYQDIASTRFVSADRDNQLRALGMDGGSSAIAAIDGKPVSNWQEIYAELRTKNPESKVAVTFATADGPKTATYTLTRAESELVREHLHFMLGLHLKNETKTQKAANAGQAMLMGMDHTKKFILNVYMTLAGLTRGTVDPSNLHGIVGITKVGYDVQERGPVWLWYVLAMVSVNLAVANFLPLPIVDGGLFLLLILEKIRGKPLSLKVQTAIQYVGIILLASLFLFVTVNDINLFTK